MKSLIKNNKGQAQSIIIFFVLIVGIFIVSIIILRLTNSILTPFQNTIGNMSAPAGVAVGQVHAKFAQWWDYAIVILFFLNVILLFVSSFLVDIHPAFIILYIISIIFLFIFGNYALYALDSIWDMLGTTTETMQTPLQQFILNHFQIIMMGVIILSGILMYAKFKMFGNTGAGGGHY
jgi:hypothetical protein